MSTSQAQRNTAGRRPRLLLVDDEPDVVAALRYRLEMAGCELVCAENGADAIEMLREQNVDLILSDFMMPELNGIELTRIVKSNPNWFDTQVVLFSCNTTPEFRKRAIEEGAVDYLPKSIGAGMIAEKVQDLIERRFPGAGGDRRFRLQLATLSKALADVVDIAEASQDAESAKKAWAAAGRLAEEIRTLADGGDKADND